MREVRETVLPEESRMKSLVTERGLGVLSGLILSLTQMAKPYAYKTERKGALQIAFIFSFLNNYFYIYLLC